MQSYAGFKILEHPHRSTSLYLTFFKHLDTDYFWSDVTSTGMSTLSSQSPPTMPRPTVASEILGTFAWHCPIAGCRTMDSGVCISGGRWVPDNKFLGWPSQGALQMTFV